MLTLGYPAQMTVLVQMAPPTPTTCIFALREEGGGVLQLILNHYMNLSLKGKEIQCES